MMNIAAFLKDRGIAFQAFEHPAVFTCEESDKLPPMPGMPSKNLFLRDGKGTKLFLVTVGHEKAVDLKELRRLLAVDKLSFAPAGALKEFLGVEPGSVTLLGLIHDREHSVTVILDEAIWNADAVQWHPLRNTSTFVIEHEGIEKFLQATGHMARIMEIPARAA